MTTNVIRDDFDPGQKELSIPWRGDRGFGPHELRRTGYVEDFKLARVGDSLYPPGYITDGMAASVVEATNWAPWSNDFSHWAKSGGADYQPAAANDRDGHPLMSRLSGIGASDSVVSLDTGKQAAGRVVVSLDIQQDVTPQFGIALYDGVAEVAVATFNLSPQITRYTLTFSGAWSNGAGHLTVRLRPGPGQTIGAAYVGRVQVEFPANGEPLTAGSYVATAGAAASGPGNRVAITAGSAYVAGLPRPFLAATLAYDALKTTGVDLIYAEMRERYVDALVDADLENPTTGRPGQDSVREETALITQDTSNAAPTVPTNPASQVYRSIVAVPVFQFDRATGTVTPFQEASRIDIGRARGELPGERIKAQSIPEDKLSSTATEGQAGLRAAFARRLANQSGNFVNGHNGELPAIEQITADTSQIAMKVHPLDGFTQGIAHYLDDPSFPVTPLQATTARRANENHPYYTGTSTYTLSKQPVVAIAELTGIVSVTESVTRGPVSGGLDTLAHTPVYSVTNVHQGGTTYDGGPGGDYIQNGDAVDWSQAGTEPSIGTSYSVTYQYVKTFTSGEYSHTSTTLTFTGGTRPDDTLPFTVDYDYGRDRVDLVYLDREGLKVGQGVPADTPVPPQVPVGALALWEVRVPYGATAASFTPRFVVGVPMERLAQLFTDMAAMKYNVATLAAQSDLRNAVGTLQGFITDPMIDDRLFDTGAAYFGGGGTRAARIAPVSGTLRMARDTAQTRLTLDTGRSTVATAGSWGGLSYAATAVIAQPLYSDTISVNPFSNFALFQPLIALSTQAWPVDQWANTATVQITVTGMLFQPSETGIVIKVDGTTVATVAADAAGKINTTFTRVMAPSGVVTATGAGGTGSAAFSVAVSWPRRDPVGETFVLPYDGDVVGFDLYFTAKDASEPVIIAVRETQAGMPTPRTPVLIQLTPAQVVTNGQPTRVTLPAPFFGKEGDRLSFTVASKSGAYRVQYAELGKQNLGTAGGYITNNPYGDGVMVASSDGAVFTPYQDRDLRFAVYMAKFNPTAVAYFTSQTFGSGITSFQLLTAARTWGGAGLVWSYSIDAEATWHPFAPGEEIPLGVVATAIVIKANLTRGANDYAGVDLNLENVVLLTNKDALASDYVSVARVFTASDTAKGFVQVYDKPGATVTPYASNDNGTTWVAGTLDSSTSIADGLTQHAYSFDLGVAHTTFRMRLHLATSDATVQPVVEQASLVVQ